MSVLWRAIIMIAELIGFMFFCVVATVIFYKKDSSSQEVVEVKRSLKYNIKFFVVNNIIILVVFLFFYPSYIFFSYKKMLIITILIMASIINIIQHLCECKQANIHTGIIVILLMVLVMENQIPILEGRKIEKNYVETTKIIPCFVSKNTIGYTTYKNEVYKFIFYYEDDKGDWCPVELEAPGVKKEILPDSENSYVEKTITSKVIVNKEKRPSAEDYSYTETEESFKFYINKKQMIPIKIKEN